MNYNYSKLFFLLFFIGLSLYFLFPNVQLYLKQDTLLSVTEEQEKTNLKEEINELKKDALVLGLDLQGGMHITFEVDLNILYRELAENLDATLLKALDEASRVAIQSPRASFADELLDILQRDDKRIRLSRYFRSESEGISRTSSNEEVLAWLKIQSNEATTRAIEILRTRVDRFGVNEPTILKQGSQRIIVELPGIEDEERVVETLKSTARLDFRLLATDSEIDLTRRTVYTYFQPDTTKQDSLSLSSNINKLAELLSPSPNNPYAFGYATEYNRDSVNALLNRSDVQKLLPRGYQFMWAASSFARYEAQKANLYYLLLVRSTPELTGDVITDASLNFDPYTNQAIVDMGMNTQGARRWALVTGANIGKPIAITLDDYVYSFPIVENKINNGRSSISGLDSREEAEDLITILKSGAFKAPLEIIEQNNVGASLGEYSIKAGTLSIISGILMVAIFMIIYYRQAGFIANVALLINMLFIFGVLAAFHATLTLPGMAGIVLTIGMAVDTNVLIFDRIREELFHGQPLHVAIPQGYRNAMSAILDANITTLLVGIILLSYGVGPIKGFALTLVTGIITSLICAIMITRFVIDYLMRRQGATINFG